MPALKRAVVMVQKEVADRIAAVPGNKTYGGYTAKLGLYAQVTGRFEVPPRCFMPAPHVDSAVVRIDRVDGVVPEGLDREFVARVIDAAFAQRRKTIRNSMSANGFAKDVLDAAFEVCGIAPTTRAETLDVADFVRSGPGANPMMPNAERVTFTKKEENGGLSRCRLAPLADTHAHLLSFWSKEVPETLAACQSRGRRPVGDDVRPHCRQAQRGGL